MNRTWTQTTWASNNTGACLDSTVAANTWFYLYLVATEDGTTTDFVVTSSRDYASTQSKLTAATGGSNYKVIRRLGAFRTNGNTDTVTGSSTIEPFTTRRLAGNTIRVDYLGNDGFTTGMGISTQMGSSITFTTFVTTTVAKDVFAQGLFNSSAATTATAAHFSSQLIRAIPPLPGISAELSILQNVAGNPLTLYFYGEPIYSSTATAYNAIGRTAMQRIRANSAMVNGDTSVETRMMTVSPDANVISDTVLAGTTVFGTSVGTFIRYAFVNQFTGNKGNVTPNLLGWEVLGYTIAR
jgi:hypothetical protein